jgi:hypothetical protein
MDLLAGFVASIDEELAMFQRNELITQDYRACVQAWAKESAVSGAFGGPTLEMESVIASTALAPPRRKTTVKR